ncbi:hypothetical protein KUTeg_015086 [Tegillarca granosa]|uniref:PX domain-containing protein n=1 Tax=Tegillarca granosa TaxID=220873 RepID=A0ABQ9ETU1_TEGGR|nr:hypothetical protein KUTeg_015086 [Tegillarca granosa]
MISHNLIYIYNDRRLVLETQKEFCLLKMSTLRTIYLCKHGLMQTRSAVQNAVTDKMTNGLLSCLQQKSGLHFTKDWTQIRGVATKTDIDKNIKEFKEGKFDKIPDPTHLEHFRKTEKPASTQQTSSIKVNTEDETPPMGTHTLPHPIWSEEELHNVQITHNPPEKFVDKLAYFSVKVMRKSFDILTRFNWGERDEKKWVLRICFLETVAGVPGMVAAMTRHLHSLRRLQRDYGWIHTLLGAFVTMFSISYLLSPRFCHRFVGYLEEEAVITYSKCLKDIDHGPLRHWKTQPAPEVALRYWKLATNLLQWMEIAVAEPEKRTTTSMKVQDTYIVYLPSYIWQNSATDKFDPEFIERRRAALEIFLLRVAAHPLLSQDKIFIGFLQQDEGWKDLVYSTGFQNKADSKLKALSASFRLKKPDRRFEDLKNYSNELESNLSNLLKIRARMADKLYGIHKCIDPALDEEEQFADQLKEYLAFGESLRSVCRKYECLQYDLERAEDNLSSKSSQKEILVNITAYM